MCWKDAKRLQNRVLPSNVGLFAAILFLSPCGLESTWAHQLPVTCKVSSVEIKCEVANGDFLGFELELVCFSHGVPLYGAKTSWLP